MKNTTKWITAGGLTLAVALTSAQAKAQGPGRGAAGKSASNQDLVTRMLAFDKNKDGSLTKSEVTDARLKRIFDRADADKDGTVTKDELTSLASSEAPPQEGGPGGGPGGPGGPGGRGRPKPGEVLPAFMRQNLELSAAQTKQLDALQKDVDARLAKILTADQKQQLNQMQQRGPGGPGGPGGGGPGGGGPGGRRPGGPGGGPGGPGGPPPDGPPPEDRPV